MKPKPARRRTALAAAALLPARAPHGGLVRSRAAAAAAAAAAPAAVVASRCHLPCLHGHWQGAFVDAGAAAVSPTHHAPCRGYHLFICHHPEPECRPPARSWLRRRPWPWSAWPTLDRLEGRYSAWLTIRWFVPGWRVRGVGGGCARPLRLCGCERDDRPLQPRPTPVMPVFAHCENEPAAPWGACPPPPPPPPLLPAPLPAAGYCRRVPSFTAFATKGGGRAREQRGTRLGRKARAWAAGEGTAHALDEESTRGLQQMQQNTSHAKQTCSAEARLEAERSWAARHAAEARTQRVARRWGGRAAGGPARCADSALASLHACSRQASPCCCRLASARSTYLPTSFPMPPPWRCRKSCAASCAFGCALNTCESTNEEGTRAPHRRACRGRLLRLGTSDGTTGGESRQQC